MFQAAQFNGDISAWNVSSVERMDAMFSHNKHFQGDLSKWDVANVTSMVAMLQGTTLQGDISQWNTSRVVRMMQLFQGSSFNGDISRWNVGRVTDFQYMFDSSAFNGDISAWDTSSAEKMAAMFRCIRFSKGTFPNGTYPARRASNACFLIALTKAVSLIGIGPPVPTWRTCSPRFTWSGALRPVCTTGSRRGRRDLESSDTWHLRQFLTEQEAMLTSCATATNNVPVF